MQPIIGSCEHDPLLLCQSSLPSATTYPEPPPPATSVVDSAIELFSILLLTQDSSSCTKIVSELVDLVHSPKLEKNTGRRTAIYYNATVALAKAFRHAMTSNVRQAKVALGNTQTANLLASFLKVFVRFFSDWFNALKTAIGSRNGFGSYPSQRRKRGPG